MEIVKRRASAFDRTIMRRDRREAVAAVIVAVLFIPALVNGPWLTRAGVLVLLAAMATIVVKLGRARRAQANEPVDRSLSELLDAERGKIDGQIRLLQRVLYWYIAPPATGALMVELGLLGASWFTLVYVVFIVVVCAWIYQINQRAVRSYLMPRRQELDRMIEELRA